MLVALKDVWPAGVCLGLWDMQWVLVMLVSLIHTNPLIAETA